MLVVDLGSISAAATVLGYTQSAVSQQLAALEREAGSVLVDRTRRIEVRELPPDVREIARQCVLDWIGVALSKWRKSMPLEAATSSNQGIPGVGIKFDLGETAEDSLAGCPEGWRG